MKYVDYSGLYRILANLKAWIKSVFVSNVTVSGRTISVTKNDQTISTDMSYPTATDAISGIVKLYGTLGASTDGTLTRAAITALEKFGYRFNGETTPSTFSNDIDTASNGDFTQDEGGSDEETFPKGSIIKCKTAGTASTSRWQLYKREIVG